MAETNTAALRAQGERDARALTVTGRRRADTGRIRRAGKALARMARAVTPETPNGQWLHDNRSFACAAAGDAVAALRHARVRASGGQTALGACCAGLLRACGGALTVKAAEAYLEGFQDALPLETAELALLVPGLQAAVVCALAESYAGDSAAAPALFTSLRALGTAAWGMLAERCDRVGRILARDPVGVYPAMDAATRAHYRQTVARLARRTGRTEIEIAEDVLARAQSGEGARRHVGWFLLREVLGEILEYTYKAFAATDYEAARHIEPVEEVVDDLVATLRANHIRRVRDGQCTVYAGLTFLDILVNVERIADQCSNVGVFTLSMFDEHIMNNHHDYIQALHQGKDPVFNRAYQEAHDKYFGELKRIERSK